MQKCYIFKIKKLILKVIRINMILIIIKILINLFSKQAYKICNNFDNCTLFYYFKFRSTNISFTYSSFFL